MKKLVQVLLIIAIFATAVIAQAQGTWTMIPGAPDPDKDSELAEDHDGNLWVTIDKVGVYRYDGESWTEFTDKDGLMTDSRGNLNLSGLSIDPEGRVWIFASRGFSWYDGKSWKELLLRYPVSGSSISHFDQDGTLWYSIDNTLCSYKNGVWKVFNGSDGLPGGPLFIRDFEIRPDGGVCVTFMYPNPENTTGSMVYATYISDGSTWQNTAMPERSDKADGFKFENLAISPGGEFLGSFEGDIFAFDGLEWGKIYDGRLLGQKAMSFDSYGNLWSSRYFSTVGCMKDGEWIDYSYLDNPFGGTLVSIATGQDGVVWMLTSTGVAKFTPGPTVVEDIEPTKFALIDNYPNPFNPSTTIEFTLAGESPVSLEIFNAAGQSVRTLAVDEFSAGTHRVFWDGLDDKSNTVSAGMYISKLRAGERTISHKMTMVK